MSKYPATKASLLLRLRDALDQDAWKEFNSLYVPLVYRFCIHRGLQEADASDVAQDVLQSVIVAIKRFHYDPKRGSFHSWLFRIVRRKLSDRFESAQRQPAGGGTSLQERLEREPAPASEDYWEREYRAHLFRWAAKKVETEFQPGSWKAFWRTSVDQEEPAQVARDLGMSMGALYIARSRVIARLRDVISTIDLDAPVPGELEHGPRLPR